MIERVLSDLDGVLVEDGEALPGAAEALSFLRRADLSLCVVTNTSTATTEALRRRLAASGLELGPGELITPVDAARRCLERRGVRRVKLALMDDAREAFADFDCVERGAEAVVIGEIGPNWTDALIQDLFRELMDGAALVAMHRSRRWQRGGELRFGIGAMVAGLEYATGRRAEVMGKPSPALFREALGPTVPERALMLGDDLVSDVGGAQALGLRGVLVKSGKYREGDLEAGGRRPDAVLDGIGELEARWPAVAGI